MLSHKEETIALNFAEKESICYAKNSFIDIFGSFVGLLS